MLNRFEKTADLNKRLGSLHDAEIHSITVDFARMAIEVQIDDFMSNFLGFENYRGPVPGVIRISGFSNLEIDFEDGEVEANIYELLLDEGADGKRGVVFKLWPCGEVSCRCQDISFPEGLYETSQE